MYIISEYVQFQVLCLLILSAIRCYIRIPPVLELGLNLNFRELFLVYPYHPEVRWFPYDIEGQQGEDRPY